MKWWYGLGAGIVSSLLLLGLLGCAMSQSQAEESPPTMQSPVAQSPAPSRPLPPAPGDPRVNFPLVDPRLVTANTRFGFKLFSEVVSETPGKNVLISPSSVAIALSMVYNGADDTTRTAMANTLELSGMTLAEVNQANAALKLSLEAADPTVKVAIANSLWSRQGVSFQPNFLRQNQQFYHAEVASLDFGRPDAVNRINRWVSRHTEGKIPQIIDRINPDDVMFLINAIYFNGTWTRPFDPRLTRPQPFHLADGTTTSHPLMAQSGSYLYTETDQFQAINLPYGDRHLSMLVFLPKPAFSLETFQATLTADNWATWVSQFRHQPGAIQLPRFKTEFGIGLNDALKTLGMDIAFDPNQANFTNLIADNSVYISQVQHKTFIDVNEAGTEAAAATSIGVTTTSMPVDPPFRMIVDRPFFYAICDNRTGTILFMGTIVNPEA